MPAPVEQPQVNPAPTIRKAIERCKRKRDELIDAWAESVDYARGKPFEVESDDDRVYVNIDNTMARRKAAQIASQLPEARLKAKHPAVQPVLGEFQARLNEVIRQANVGDALFETAKDVINAAGVGVVIVGYEARTETVQTPNIDPATATPEQQEAIRAAQDLKPDEAAQLLGMFGVQMINTPRVTSSRFYARRVSPSDFLWPLDFERSNFDEAPWLGHSARMRVAEARVAFKLSAAQVEKMKASARERENLRDDGDTESRSDDDLIAYDEIFYWRAQYDPQEKSYHAIWRVVYVEGVEEPVIHEAWTGQKYLDGAGYVGACKLPIRVLTLDYLSDDPIPPSDSAIARPQVNELMRSRTQMILQRERSMPLRWHDVNRVDPLTSAQIMRGTYQASIPVKGNGNAVIGEVARANYPAESFEFGRIIKGDLTEAWGVDSNQLGMFAMGRRTAREADVVQQNFATQTGFQRARVAAFFCGIAEVLAGLFVLYGQELPQPPPAQEGQPPLDLSRLSQLVDYSVLPDSTVLLDANQRASQLLDVLDMVGKSGFVNPEPIVREVILLKGLDPEKVMRKPEPPPQEPPAISYRFGGAEDLTNPVVLAMLIEKGQAPSPDSLKAAFKILQEAGIPTMAPPPPPELPPGGPMGDPMGDPGGAAPPQEPLPPADARPDWTAMPTVTKRSDA